MEYAGLTKVPPLGLLAQFPEVGHVAVLFPTPTMRDPETVRSMFTSFDKYVGKDPKRCRLTTVNYSLIRNRSLDISKPRTDAWHGVKCPPQPHNLPNSTSTLLKFYLMSVAIFGV